MPRRPAGARLPLSHAQERMWFFHQLDPAASAYNVCILWRLTGDLDRAALRAAFDRICARHEVLRTVYPIDGDGVPHQHVLAELAPEWAELDLSHLAGDRQERALLDLAAEAGRAPFDLASRSPLHLTLVRLGTQAGGEASDPGRSSTVGRHALVMVGQHITWDGPAFGVFARELSTAYADCLAGRPDSLPPLTVQYGDFAAWHRQRWGRPDGSEETGEDGRVRDDVARQLAYWRDRFTPLPTPLSLPADAERGADVDETGGWVTRHVGAELTAALLELGATEQATPFMVLSAGIATLLGRWCGAEEVTLGTVFQNRDEPDLAPLIGNLGNTVALRIDVSGRPTFRELLRRVRDVCSGAYAHGDVPFDRVLDELGVPRSLDRSPLFDVMVVFLSQDMASPELPGLDVAWEKFHNGTTQTDLSLDALLRDGRLGLQATYRAALFRPDTVARLLARLEHILDQAVADPERPVHDLDLLLPYERPLVTDRWAVTPAVAVGPSAPETVPGLFEAQVASTPDASALHFGDDAWTFAELNARANRMARLLVRAGVGPEDRVALALPRGADALVAILAVLKAGAAYVPLDPRYPAEHLAHVLDDAGPSCLITAGAADDTGVDGLRLPPGTLIVRLGDPGTEADLASLDGHDLTDAERAAPLLPAHPAMVVFTSGSTGRPKGVVVPHAGLVNLFRSHRSELHALARDRTGKAHLDVGHAWSFAFDASWQPQLWLLDGHAVHVVPYEVYADPEALAAEIARRRIDFIELTPSLLEATLDALDQRGHLPSVVGFGGEAVSPALWDRLAGLPVAAFNLYGPTEATVDALVARVAPGTGPAVGHPVAGTRVAVLDAGLRPVPPGVPGELYIAGPGLARGYLDQPARTAERFVADPFGPPGARAYRTGDLVRWRDDGELEFLGRSDDQVKIRGFRVEPAEVEAALRRVSADRQVVVTVREDRPGDRRLVGYVVDGSGVVDPAAVRAELAGELPEHLVPSAVVVIDALPLLPNGKLDRTALPAPASATPGTGPAPRTPVERDLAGLFAEVLGLASVGIDDGFFELGGDSILAIQLVSRARRAGWSFRPRDVFTSQSVRRLAAVATAQQAVGAGDEEEAGGPIPVTPIASAHAERGGPIERFAQSVLVRLPAGLDDAALAAGLQAVLDHHEVLRARLLQGDGGWALDPAPVGAVPAPDCLRTVAAAPYEELIAQHAVAAAGRLDPVGGTMVQAVRFDAGVLLVVAHHLVVDGVSWRILVGDLAAACTAIEAGEPVVLPPVGTSLRRWSSMLRASAEAGPASSELDHWRATLDRPDPPLGTRPLDPTRDTVATARTTRRRLSSAATSAVLTRVPSRFHAETDHVLLAGLALAVTEWRARRGIDPAPLLVDVEGHGRDGGDTGADLDRTVGWLTSLHPVALDPGVAPGDPGWDDVWSGGSSAGDVLRRVKEQLRAVPGGGVGYGALRHLRPDTAAELAALTSSQLGFNHLGRFSTGGDERPWSVVPRVAAAGETMDGALPLAHAIEVTSVVEDTADGPVLAAIWAWPDGLLDAVDVDELAGLWFQALEALVAHADQPGAGGRTPSDLPLVSLTQREIVRLEAAVPAFDDLWPLTPLQELMLGHGADPWMSQVAFTVGPPIDAASLRRAAEELLRRQPNLRAGFRGDDGLAFVPTETAVPWREVDLRGLDDAAASAEVARIEADERARPLDPAAPPLLRFTAIRLPGGGCRVVLASHHLLLDGWSVPLALADLLALATDLGDPPTARQPYRAFLEWLAAQDTGASVDAWAAALEGLDGPTLVAPGHVPRPTVDLGRTLSHDLTARLTGRAGQLGVTLNSIVQAAWAVTLAGLTGRRDVTFGAFASGRPPALDGMESIVGLLLGLVPVRGRVVADFGSVARDIQVQQAALSEHPHVRPTDVARRLGLPALFDTVVVFESFPGQVATAPRPGPAVRDVVWSDSIGFPLGLFCYPGETLALRLCHDPSAVDAGTAERVADDLVAMLEAVAGDPSVAIDDLLGGDRAHR